MPDLLLTPTPTPQTKNTNIKPQQTDKLIRNEPRSEMETTEVKSKSPERFDKVLSETVEKTKSKKDSLGEQVEPEKPVVEVVKDTIQQIAEEVKVLMPDSEVSADLELWLEGQDFSASSMAEMLNGLDLPELKEKLNALIDTLTTRLEELGEINQDIQTEEQSQLLGLLDQVSSIVTGLNELEDQKQISPAMLVFTMTGNDNAGKFQMNESSQHNVPQGVSLQQGYIQQSQTSLEGDPYMTNETVVSEGDQYFQMKMDQAMNDSFKDVSELKEAVIDNLTETKEKPVVKFGDLQLRAANEGIKNYSTTLTTPVTSQQWSEEVSQKIVWFSGRNIQAAEMHLNPAELGPIDVKVHVQNDVTSVTFNVNNSSVRELLESNVVRLREMIESNGVNLGDVDINSGTQDQSQQAGSDKNKSFFGRADNSEIEDAEVREEQIVQVKTSNLVDYFV